MLPRSSKKLSTGWIFQHENNPKLIVKSIEFFNSEKIVLKWSFESSDLNPLEHLWKYLDCQLVG